MISPQSRIVLPFTDRKSKYRYLHYTDHWSAYKKIFVFIFIRKLHQITIFSAVMIAKDCFIYGICNCFNVMKQQFTLKLLCSYVEKTYEIKNKTKKYPSAAQLGIFLPYCHIEILIFQLNKLFEKVTKIILLVTEFPCQ